MIDEPEVAEANEIAEFKAKSQIRSAQIVEFVNTIEPVDATTVAGLMAAAAFITAQKAPNLFVAMARGTAAGNLLSELVIKEYTAKIKAKRKGD